MKRTGLFRLLALACGLASSVASHAQAQAPAPALAGFPSHAVRFIVPIGPGSSGDTLTRMFAEQFRVVSGQPVLVENRPGADLVVGTQNLLMSPPDGHSLVLISNSTMAINPVFVKDLPYSTDDLIALLGMSRNPAVLVTAAESAYRTLAELLDAARRQPGSVGIGVYGNSYRLGTVDLSRRTGVRLNIVSYKGAAQALGDVAGGTLDAALIDIGAAVPLASAGKVRVLAVASDTRHAALPAVPTFREAGVADYSLYTFIGFAIHARTPVAIVNRMEALLAQTMTQPGLREQMARQSGGEITGIGRQMFSAAIAVEAERVRELAKSAGADLLR